LSYKREEVYITSLEYFEGDELATNVWIDKYCLKDGDKYLELTPDDMHWRLAKEFYRIEQKYKNPTPLEHIYGLLKDFKYIVPQGGGMYGIGNPILSSLSNCFVVGNDVDSYGGILLTDQEMVQLAKRRGGVGCDLSHIRPRGVRVDNSAGTSSGISPFAERYSNTIREVAQNGRNGALMLSVDVEHPDAEEFVDMKVDTSKITGANISIKASDNFMKAALSNRDFCTTFKGKPFGKKAAKPLFDKLVYNAWKSAEPGCLFFDRILEESPARGYGDELREVSTNPCGELPLPPKDSCRLIAINLFNYVANPFSKEATFLMDMLVQDTKVAQRIMDDFVDLEIEKIDGIIKKIESSNDPKEIKIVELNLWNGVKKMANSYRRTGLGYTGLGDMIAALGLTYGTEQATNFTTEVQQLFASASYVSSIELAEERGCFDGWSEEKDMESDFLKRMFKNNPLIGDEILTKYKKFGRRNIGNLTIAPTGTVSLMTQTTSGIEPLFSPWYYRRRKTDDPKKSVHTDEVGDMWEEFAVFHKPFVLWFISSNEPSLSYSEALSMLELKSKDELTSIFESSPYFKATAQDVDYIEKVRMQGGVQKWVDHSISVTVNMPENTTVETVAKVYEEAWKSGCKGVTVYRDGSRAGILNTKSADERDNSNHDYIPAKKRSKSVECDVYFKKALGGEYIIFVGVEKGRPMEVFAVEYKREFGIPRGINKGSITKIKKQHYRFESDNYVIDNLIDHMIETEQRQTRDYSLMLRHRIDPRWIVDSIRSYATISSFQKAISNVLVNYAEAEEKNSGCPECGGVVAMSDGCMKCIDCGYSKCG